MLESMLDSFCLYMKRILGVVVVIGMAFASLPSHLVLAHGDDHEIEVCHKDSDDSDRSGHFSTKEIKHTELNGHIKHGDTLGSCPDDSHDNTNKRISVSGYKFEDKNGNGAWEASESALAGWTVFAYSGAGQNQTILDSDVTDRNGAYQLQFKTRSASQDVYIAERLQDGWRQTAPGSATNYQYPILAGSGTKFTDVNFGNQIDEKCDGSELVVNGGFEKPGVKSSQRWEAFVNGTVGLVWKVFRKDGSTTSKGLELQRGYSGWLSDEGQQFAELDSYHPVRISQDINTIPGQMYKVSFAFSPRPGTPAAENAVDVTWSGKPVAAVAAESAVTSQTSWKTYTYWIPATTEVTALTFADAGATANTLGTFIDDVSVQCTSENGRMFTGGKFDDVNGDGIWGDGEAGLPDWDVYAAKTMGSFTVSATGGAVTSPVLETGKTYVAQVTGTIQAGSDITADAMYSVKSPNTTWTDAVQTYESSGPTLLDLQVDGVSPFWGEYTSDHTYFTFLVGSGAAQTFALRDDSALGQSGEFHVSLFEIMKTAVTDAAGHYVLEAADWNGAEPIVILESLWKPGWTQTFPGFSRGAVHLVSWDEAWSQNWSYNFGNHVVTHDEEPPDEPPQTGTLAMAVNVVNDNGGLKSDADFSVAITDVNGVQTIPGSATVTNIQVKDGYTTSLVGNTEGYSVTYSLECNDTMPAGGSRACIVTVDDMDVFSVTAPVAPLVTCVSSAGDGKLSAHFGYINLNSGPVFIPAGTVDNRVVGGGLTGTNQGQPSFFQPGLIDDAFQVVFDPAIPVVWAINTVIGEFSIEANLLTEQCPSPIVP